MLSGRGATVEVRTVADRNAFGEALYSAESVDVENVLIQPGGTEDTGAERPEGVDVVLTLHWPKTALDMDLRDAVVTLTGEYAGTYRVVGDPVPYQSELCPLPWCMPVEVVRHDG